ncbi:MULTISPECIES: AraC family transcriptional regulator [Pseudomonas]|jgi:AraC-like DNA-binding protein/quercetin dioxygenase-like cupin family protein|uniref:AraC family transcriptional regulator n=1 Tax=Pseudomonas simiae TaxID=321846 RepID=A0A1N7U7N8_9PSED|nr:MULTISPECIES: helix-turn-helix transcriptional regulator [Pseudomonas]MBD8740902.1 helix-turn-helix transcriptional regulator [Pseudomonas fluorescens]PHX41062.1 AraC family transcriptional regulator [Pseudomonas sp. NZIPFR-PS2]AIB36966.1 AraC family transcriptional regulator [Pseudomonas simiae]KIQ07074.1 AraC family transcriptional regulator [Pseudomonas simiae]MBC3963981.1 helix-turn-helix transcriptional regulator [Pseudomonas simiae]
MQRHRLDHRDPARVRDADLLPRAVVAVNATSTSESWEHAPHSHRKGQLMYTLRGVIHCQIEAGIWIVPPQCALWIPGGLPHAARGSGEAEVYCLLIDPDAAGALPAQCCTLSVSGLLHELISKAVSFPQLYDEDGAQGRLIRTLLDELAQAPIEDLHLPMPRDPRLRRLADSLLADPGDKATLGQWAMRIGMSERSMTRLLLEEFGLSFGRWRRQLHVILSLQRLARGDSVQRVALDLGYENASGFITMFRKAVGQPPARYLADRAGAPTANAAATIALHALQTPDQR